MTGRRSNQLSHWAVSGYYTYPENCIQEIIRLSTFALRTAHRAGHLENFVFSVPSLRECPGCSFHVPRNASIPLSMSGPSSPLSPPSWSCPRPISSGQLHTLLHFHLRPIYLVVFKGSYWLLPGRSHLEGGFTLRCLQRLSRPGLAILLCAWQPNRFTSGRSIPVLSY